ncbi:MAG: hypothetical protein QOJ65_102, partial [Fimbriimonadaceae bacterium]|nr:hypothetical protein [Fimbriimonadaceae bacterium]
PGTILLGARTNPDDPWILSRNTQATPAEIGEIPTVAAFEYEFSLLPEIKATGRFYETPGPVPQVVWHINLENDGRITLEIGELGFPMALNNLYEGFPREDRGVEALYRDRLYLHPFIGGAASYLFAQRLSAEPPGLIVTPGQGTSWEFCHHVPASLNTPYRWGGIPVMYVLSRAAVEREGWGEWFNGHTSKVLEPGDKLEIQTRFMSGSRDRFDGLFATMAAGRRPTMRIFPAAVAPFDVGIAVEVAGSTPTQFYTDREADLDTDSDEDGGFCHVKPKAAGPLTLSFEDTDGRISNAHLMFTEPIASLIKKRAEWLVRHQLFEDQGSNLDGAFVPYNTKANHPNTDPSDYISPFGVESILSDALFLAEKNRIYPERSQIAILEGFVDRFLRTNLQNPATGAVASSFMDSVSTGVHFGRPQVYPMVAVLYHALSCISRDTGTKLHDASFYLCQAAATVEAMERCADPAAWRGCGVPLMSLMHEIKADLAKTDAEFPLRNRAEDLSKRRYPLAGSQSPWDTTGYDEVHAAALETGNANLQERVMSAAFAARSTAPSWWWYGSDKRWLDDADLSPHPALEDKGELCFGPTSSANSEILFRALQRDALSVPDPMMRMAFGGMLGVWALVKPDGSASTGFCPDPASKHYGFNPNTGTVGLALFHYLRNACSYVLPSPTTGAITFGCTFEAKEKDDGLELRVKPWDGVGRRVVVRQVGFEVEAQAGKIREVRVHTRKRRAFVEVENTAATQRICHLVIGGLWGSQFEVNGKKEHTAGGTLSVERPVPPGGVLAVEVNVLG